MLLSYVNTKLRDEYSSFEEMCSELELSAEEIEQTLRDAGFVYRPQENRFA